MLLDKPAYDMAARHNKKNDSPIGTNIISKIFPFIAWFKGYKIETLRADFISGLTVALVLVPQSMAYAQLAGLPAYYGLYAAFLPPMIASLFGSSRQLATGPVAVVSLMTATALEPLATAGSEAFIAYAIVLALLVGIFQFALGILKLGLVVNFLSHPVVNGFTNAAALIIATSQLSKIFGVHVDSASHHYETVYNVIAASLSYTHWPTVGLAVLAFAIMFGIRKINRRLPSVLFAVIVTTIISWAIDFERNRQFSVEKINSSGTKLLIANFNETLDDIDKKSEIRVQIRSQITGILETDGNQYSEVLELEHKIAMLNVEIQTLREQAARTRTALRKSHFKLFVDSQGDTLLNDEGLIEPGDNSGYGHWRIKVGNTPLDETAITFVGGGEVVGIIPRGLPAFKTPKLDFEVILSLFPMAAIISLLGFMEAISIAKAMAARTGQRLDPDQELIGQGLANIVGSLGQSYAVSGSFSRSAVNIQAGAISGLSNVFSSGVVVITLLFFTPLLFHLPQAVLAAIIMMAVIGLVNVRPFIHAWRAQRFDGIVGIITFVCTLAFAPHLDRGIMVGVLLSLGGHLFRGMKPDIALLSMHPDGTYRNSVRFRLRQCRHIAVIRYFGSLFFANVNYLEEQILERVASMPELKHILIVGNGINHLDASGEETLSRLVTSLRDAGYDLSISGLNDQVLDVMQRSGLLSQIGDDHIFRTAARAIQSIYDRTHAGTTEQLCPLKQPGLAGLPVSKSIRRSLLGGGAVKVLKIKGKNTSGK